MIAYSTTDDLGLRCSRLEQEIAEIEQKNITLEQKTIELEAKVRWFEEQHRLALARQYSASSEQTPLGQERLVFNEAEALADESVPEPTLEVIAYKRRKTKGLRDSQLDGLPEEIVEYTLPLEAQTCTACTGPLHKMGEDIRREVKIVPAQISVVKHVRHVYSCRHCQRHEIETPVAVAPMPPPAFPNSIASPSLVAHIMNCKFTEGLPLYRQEQIMMRSGIELSRQTMANWMIKGADHLSVIYDRLKAELLTRDILHADETTLQVLHEKDRPAQTNSYLWLYRSGRDGPPIVLFEYKPTRAGEHPQRYLKGFKGYLHVDGYSAYGCLDSVTLVGCWAHARRGFTDALKSLPPAAQKTALASQGLEFCNKLFAIERDLCDKKQDERFDARLTKSAAVLADFKVWLDQKSQDAMPKSTTGKAIAYCVNQWPKLTGFLKDGRLELDNNRSERSIKPFVIGRKNWLFSNTPKGADASATIYSIVETAKENGLNPRAYLTYLLEILPTIDTMNPRAIDELLPSSYAVQAKCSTPSPAKPQL